MPSRPARKDVPERPDFLPVLLKVEASADMLNPDEDLWVTSWWQNAGSAPADRPLQGFLEMEFGHQRTLETNPGSHRVLWEPHPGPHRWQPGEVWATTCRWHVSHMWGGTFRLHLGLCDADHVPIDIGGRGGATVKRAYIGDVEVGWGWGMPSVELARKPWSRELNAPQGAPAAPADPGKTIRLEDGIRAELAANAPLLLGVSDTAAKFRFPPSAPEAILRRLADDTLACTCERGMSLVCDDVAAGPACATYSCSARRDGEVLASWKLRFAVKGRRLAISLEDVRETDGYELLEVVMPSLVSAAGPEARMVDFYSGGRLISPEAARPIGYVHPYDVRNAAAVYDAHGTIVVESQRLDDKLYASVQEDAGGRRAVLGIALVHRVRARGKLRSLEVIHPPKVEIDLLDASWGGPSWQAAARFLRRDLRRNAYYDVYRRALVYKQLVSVGPQPEPWQIRPDSPSSVTSLARTRTFKQMHEVMRRIHNLLDGGPQVFYITGWQYRGFDTGYPYVLETDPRVGTIEELRECIQLGPRYNAVVGLHDNYDDCYPGEHLGDHPVAMDAEGRPWKGWIWPGGQSYITGFRRYAESGQMQQRVKQTVETYGIGKSYHLDVLSSEVRRYDYDPAGPAAADAGLHAKLAIVDEFNKHGTDITSELLAHPFVGSIGWAWAARDERRSVLFPGEKYIPLTSMVYHGTIDYNCRRGRGDGSLLWAMIQGAGGGWTESYEIAQEPENLKWHYVLTFPMALLADRQIEDYREDDGGVFVDYGPAGHVRVNVDARTYEIVVDGRTVGRNWTTFAPGFREGSYLAYSLRGGPLEYAAPDGWADGARIEAVTLTGDGEGERISGMIAGGKVALEMPAGVPVRVTCGRGNTN